MNMGILCLLLFLAFAQVDEAPQNLHITVVEGTLHAEYTLTTEKTGCSQGDALDIKAHISWYTEKEKTTQFSLVMKGTPYTQSELSEKLKTPVVLESHNQLSLYESEDISGFWDMWFTDISAYGVFADYSSKVLFNWNEVEITLHEDEKGSLYSLKATYYDFFTKFYPTPEAFFDEREIDFQLIFGIRRLIPKTVLSIVIELPEEAEVVLVDPPFQATDEGILILTGEPDVTIPNIRVKFKMGRYKGTELPSIHVSRDISSHSIQIHDKVTITITVQNTSSVEAFEVKIQDIIPDAFEVIEGEPLLSVQNLEGHTSVVLTYVVRARNTGDYLLKGTHVEFEDQFGRMYTAYSEDISLVVVTKSGTSACIVIVSLFIFALRKRRTQKT